MELKTRRAVRYHGWTLPAGSTVQAERIVLDTKGFCRPTATCRWAGYAYNIAVPMSALPYAAWDCLPVVSQ